MDGNDGVYCTMGPLAASARDLDLFMIGRTGHQPSTQRPLPYSATLVNSSGSNQASSRYHDEQWRRHPSATRFVCFRDG
jgi:hypothetical protein